MLNQNVEIGMLDRYYNSENLEDIINDKALEQVSIVKVVVMHIRRGVK